jgi:5-methylcytosine-specific restriction endonuclease McrA
MTKPIWWQGKYYIPKCIRAKKPCATHKDGRYKHYPCGEKEGHLLGRDYWHKYKEQGNAYRRGCRKNPQFRLAEAISRGMRYSLEAKKNGVHWEELVGYTLEDLIKHLEARFEPWMTWNNYGEWHVDHIKPKSLFRYENTEASEFKKCWALENLQPLRATENIKKGKRWTVVE